MRLGRDGSAITEHYENTYCQKRPCYKMVSEILNKRCPYFITKDKLKESTQCPIT